MSTSSTFARSWAVSVLEGIRAPVTASNIDFLEHWQAAEGGPSDNPLNTTLGQPGAQGSSIRGYGSVQAGVDATVQTLLQPAYSSVVQAFRKGSTEGTIGAAVIASPWDGSAHYAGTDFWNWILSQPGGLSYASTGISIPGVSTIEGAVANVNPVTGAYDVGKSAGEAVTSVAKAIEWVFSNWLRIFEFLGGAVLGIFGLVLLGRAGREAA